MKLTPTFKLPNGTYFGGKGAAGVVHHIVNQIPAHDIFISGCLGRCQVTQWKLPAKRTIGIDRNLDIIEQWEYLNPEGMTLLHANVLDLMGYGTYFQTPRAFLYLDPPYPHSTRAMTNKFKYEMSDADHIALCRAARSLPCMVAISTYDNEIYQAELPMWRKINFPSQTRGGTRTETLYMNYHEPTPEQLHDPRFLGADFRAREKSKRRVNTILRKIERLTPTEKAILQQQIQ